MPRGNHATSQTTKATLGLRELLLDGAFEPRERVPELRLVEELGVSRTPLRIALMTLEHEGLLETLPGGGFVVREFTRTDIDDAIELRGVLEGTAARLAAERLESDEELEPLRDCCRELDAVVRTQSIETFMEYLRLNEEFHDIFRGLAKSTQLGRALEHALALPFAPPSALLMVHSALPESWEILLVAQHQHYALIDAIARREGARADAIAREHARLARRNLDVALENRQLLERVPGGDVAAASRRILSDVSLEVGTVRLDGGVHVRAMRDDDVGAADLVMRLAFGTARGLPDPATAFGDRDLVRARYRAAPECAWVAEIAGELVGSVFAARWGSFGFLGPLTVHPRLWDRGVGSLLLHPVLEAFEEWGLRQAGLFTFTDSPKHLGLYQKHGFWPGSLTVVSSKAVAAPAPHSYALLSDEGERGRELVLDEACRLTDQVFAGLDLRREIVAVSELGLGDTIVLRGERDLEGMAVCHCGAGTEAGGDTCYVKFAVARPGEGAPARFERLVDACEAYAALRGLSRIVVGVDTGRRDAYRRLLARGFRAEQIGLSMWLRPDEPRLDGPEQHVIDDLR